MTTHDHSFKVGDEVWFVVSYKNGEAHAVEKGIIGAMYLGGICDIHFGWGDVEKSRRLSEVYRTREAAKAAFIRQLEAALEEARKV